METIVLDKDKKLLCETARSFPNGVLEAHQKLHAKIPFSPERNYFGLSRPENGPIVYKAAAEALGPEEADKFNCETLTLKKGKYISLFIENFKKDIQSIGRAFEQLLSHSEIDPEGYCVEWYAGENAVKCMVRLRS